MPIETFLQRQQQFSQAEQVAKKRYNQLALWRLAWFIGCAVGVWLFIRLNEQLFAIATLLVGIVGFLILLKRHQRIRYERDLNHHLVFVNRDEEARLKRHYLRAETGEEFASATHYYAGDLDVFGKHSLFRLLNRTHTYEGKKRLATWLKAPAPPDVIRLRQQAVDELKPKIDWRQQFEALAYVEETVGQSSDKLVEWATAPEVSLPNYVKIARYVLPAVTLGLVVSWLLGWLPGVAVLLGLAVQAGVLSQVAAQAKTVSEQTFEMSTALGAFRALFRQAREFEGNSILLRTIQQDIVSNKQSAAEAIQHLSALTEGLNYRRNPYFSLFVGIATLWDVHYLVRLGNWRKTHGSDLRRWFEALGELEALNSLAGFSFAHPSYVTPDIVEDEFLLDFTAAAHPLLPPERSVANSLKLSGYGQTILITGSNMSGKSTFLRTVGANVVLALAGGVVSAERFWCSPVCVFTSMRTQDSLEESTSSFYAELKRLKTLINLTKQPVRIAQGHFPVLYFLDEILKGTNSADRHKGAEALIRQLHDTSASGFVSTHDLELGQLADADDFVRNYHFQSDVVNGELVFDYKLRNGICESFNASQLMQAIGISMGIVQK